MWGSINGRDWLYYDLWSFGLEQIINQHSGRVRKKDFCTHFTPNRSLNMMWFLKVRLTSKSICFISVEKVRACCFIFWKTRKKTERWPEDIKNNCPGLKMASPPLVWPHIFLRCPAWLSQCPAARPRPDLWAAEGCLYTHVSPTTHTCEGTTKRHHLNKGPLEHRGFRECGFRK